MCQVNFLEISNLHRCVVNAFDHCKIALFSFSSAPSLDLHVNLSNPAPEGSAGYFLPVFTQVSFFAAENPPPLVSPCQTCRLYGSAMALGCNRERNGIFHLPVRPDEKRIFCVLRFTKS